MWRQIKFVIWFPVVMVTVFAAGYLFWQKILIPGPYDLQPINVIRHQTNVIRHQTAESLNTNDWQIYRNEKYGFEVKYPPNWSRKPYAGLSLLDGEGLASFYSNQTVEGQSNLSVMKVSMATINNPRQLPLQQLLKSDYDDCFKNSGPEPALQCNLLDVDTSNWQRVNVGGQVALKSGSNDYIPNDTYILKGTKIVEVQATISTKNQADYLGTFDQILSTFKFIEPGSKE